MVNFVYLVGDRDTGDASSSTPPTPSTSCSRRVDADGMHVAGAIATHYHPDHVGGVADGPPHRGRSRRSLERVPCPVHVQRAEAPWVARTTGLSESDLRRTRPRRHGDGGRGRRSRCCTRPATRRAASASSSTGWLRHRRHAVPRRVRAHRLPRRRSRGDVRQPPAPGRAARRHGGLPRPPLLAAVGGTIEAVRQQNYVYQPRSKDEWLTMFGR